MENLPRKRERSPDKKVTFSDDVEMLGYNNEDTGTFKNMYCCVKIFLNVVVITGVVGLGYFYYYDLF